MLVPLTAIVTSALPMAAAVVLCAKDRSTVHAKNKSDKSGKSSRSGKPGSKSRRSSKSKSHRSGSSSHQRSKKSHRSRRSSKSAKTGAKKGEEPKSAKSSAESSTATGASSDVSKSTKSSRKSKSSKSGKNRRLDCDAAKKMEKSGKCVKEAGKVCPKEKECSSKKLVTSERGEQNQKSLVDEVNAIKHSNQLAVVPARLQYQTLGGVNQLELKNTSAERKAFKVKCSDKALYRVNPVYGFAEPRSTVKIDVLRLNGEEKTDKLVLLTANAQDAQDPRDVFVQSAEHREMMVVPLVAA